MMRRRAAVACEYKQTMLWFALSRYERFCWYTISKCLIDWCGFHHQVTEDASDLAKLPLLTHSRIQPKRGRNRTIASAHMHTCKYYIPNYTPSPPTISTYITGKIARTHRVTIKCLHRYFYRAVAGAASLDRYTQLCLYRSEVHSNSSESQRKLTACYNTVHSNCFPAFTRTSLMHYSIRALGNVIRTFPGIFTTSSLTNEYPSI